MKSYGFRNVVAVVNGFTLSGFPEGDDVIVCERLNDSAFSSMGVDGIMTVSLSEDHSGTIVIQLMQNSESNGLLSGIIAAQENGLFTPSFVQVSNTQGGELTSGTQGFLMNPASIQFGQQMQAVEWTFVMERLDIANLGVAA